MVDPVTLGVGAGIQLAGGLIGYLIERGAQNEADEILRRAQDIYGGVSDESVRKAAAEVLGPTNLAKIQVDPRYRQAQRDVLAELAGIRDRGGYTLEDRANLADVQNQTAAEASSAQNAMLAGLSRRGMAGGGAEIAASLGNQQAAANRNSQAGLRVAAEAQRRALEALRDRAALAGEMGREDYGRARDTAAAQDAIDRFNNTAGYQRAVDDYQRQLGMADRRYGMEQDRAANVRGAGQRSGGFARDMSGAAGRTVQSYGAFGLGDGTQQPRDNYGSGDDPDKPTGY